MTRKQCGEGKRPMEDSLHCSYYSHDYKVFCIPSKSHLCFKIKAWNSKHWVWWPYRGWTRRWRIWDNSELHSETLPQRKRQSLTILHSPKIPDNWSSISLLSRLSPLLDFHTAFSLLFYVFADTFRGRTWTSQAACHTDESVNSHSNGHWKNWTWWESTRRLTSQTNPFKPNFFGPILLRLQWNMGQSTDCLLSGSNQES